MRSASSARVLSKNQFTASQLLLTHCRTFPGTQSHHTAISKARVVYDECAKAGTFARTYYKGCKATQPSLSDKRQTIEFQSSRVSKASLVASTSFDATRPGGSWAAMRQLVQLTSSWVLALSLANMAAVAPDEGHASGTPAATATQRATVTKIDPVEQHRKSFVH